MANEKRLIYADEAKGLFEDIPPFIGMTGKCVQQMLDIVPAVDAAPVVHGRWGIEVGMNYYRERICPICNKRIESNFWNYCPNCGAKMDLEEYDG